MRFTLSDIFLGNSDGEAESKNPDFMELFYKNNQYFEITQNRIKFIISGQKGTGKTILAKYIEKAYNDGGTNICRILDRHDITLSRLIEIDDTYLDKDEIIIFYKWFILKEISNMIRGHRIKYKQISGKNRVERIINYYHYKKNLNLLDQFLDIRYNEGNYESKGYSDAEQITVGLKSELGAIPFNSFKSHCEAFKKHDTQFFKKPYYKVLDELRKYTFACLKYYRITLIIDDIDEIDVKLEDDHASKEAMLKLLYAIKEINDEMCDADITQSKVILVIRSDILITLNRQASNLNKILSDREVTLYWLDKQYSNPEDHPLMDMILTKARISYPGFQKYNNKELYKILFPEKVNGKEVLYYLLDCSFGRPRDIINYLNIVKEKYSKATYFSPSMFIDSMALYSTKFMNELRNELNVHFEAEYVEDMMNLLKTFNKRHFKYEELEQFFENNRRKYKHIIDLKRSVIELYKFGVLGNTIYNKDKRKTKYYWGYRVDGEINPDFNKEFIIHYGLKKALGL